MVRSRPWVRVKMAASLDGRTALPDGRSQWITQEAARLDGHDWRARATAVLTGIGTVLADNPRMDVRSREVPHQPLRLVMDRHWRTPLPAALLREPERALVIGLQAAEPDARARHDALAAAGVPTLALPELAWPEVLQALAARGVNELHVEAGATLTGSLIASGLDDEWLVYLAPKLLGAGRGLADLPALADLAQAPTLAWHSVATVGADLRLLARRPGAADF
jgi:diaminohydroxyphosphoribosylaminopyrimidine deaminase/5-amino-6-(5-phosphoribosylamino)uracil reductase